MRNMLPSAEKEKSEGNVSFKGKVIIVWGFKYADDI